ncbi:hypothetical protein GUJ93_ZPchr0013g33835 [Zizania palustris]|uniref:Uncharacterized protein n=1 Tax=Zizania palustris TaxID=103762 RepID=A0A8J6C518_ZIZPA|nr:hypothetical protein GUJ93_ZPchr0013g33835 [Zizania palustris]
MAGSAGGARAASGRSRKQRGGRGELRRRSATHRDGGMQRSDPASGLRAWPSWRNSAEGEGGAQLKLSPPVGSSY